VTKLRVGDIVNFKARVTAVADYDGAQQIQANLIPAGRTLGWCVPTEYSFTPVEFVLKVGDHVKWSQRSARNDSYEILLLASSGQATVRRVGDMTIEIAQINHLERI
jgi:hypothetical protein